MKQKKRTPPLANLFKIWFNNPASMAEMFEIFARESHPIIRLIHFHRTYFINDPNEAQRILQKPEDTYVKKGFFNQAVKMVFGEGLATSTGRSWRKQRELLQPEFHPKKLEVWCSQTTKIIDNYLQERWEPLKKSKKSFNIANEMSYCVLKITSNLLFSIDFQEKTQKLIDITSFCQKFINNYYLIPHQYPSYHRWKFRRLNKTFIHPLLDQLILEHKKAVNPPQDLLTSLLTAIDPDTLEPYPEQLIKDEIITFLVTGYETTGALLGWLWYELGKNPDVYEKILKELNEVLQGRVPTYDDLSHLTYLRCVVDETLRLYPTIWCIPRYSLKEDIIAGYTIPKHSNVLINPLSFHRNKNFWKDPFIFNPDRFKRTHIHEKPKVAYFPFGIGERVCIGRNLALQESLLIIAMIMQRYPIKILTKKRPKQLTLVSMKPIGGVKAKISDHIPS
jgi:cytochrome P450